MGTMIESFYAVLGYKVDTQSAKKADAQLDKTKAKTETLNKAILGLGVGFAAERIFGFIDRLAGEADQIKDLSESLDVGTTSLQSLGYAAQLSGSSLEGVSQALQIMQKNSYLAANGSKEILKQFTSLGISVKDIKSDSPDELLLRVADAIADTENPAKKTAIAMKLFGGQGKKLLPFLSQGADGIKELTDQFKELGLGFSEDAIKQAGDFKDEMDKVHFSVQGLASVLGVTLLPAITRVVTGLTGFLNTAVKFAKGTDIVNALLTTGIGLLVLYSLSWLAANASMLKTVAIFAALVAGVEDVYTMLRGGKSLIGSWLDKWFGLGTTDSLVRSIGQGLQVIQDIIKSPSWDKFFDAINPKKAIELSAKRSVLNEAIERNEKNLARAKLDLQQSTTIAQRDDAERRITVAQNILKSTREELFGIASNLSRTVGRGLNGTKEEIQQGTATASAVNEGAYNSYTVGPDVIAKTNSQGQTIVVPKETTNNITVNTKGGDPKEIAREVKAAMDEREQQEYEQVRASIRRGK